MLKTHFGYDAFLPLQEEIVGSVMAGRDTFALMPTGGGKSLCYQLPALALPGLTLVVSPLIALMKDQVDGLEANGIPAGFINSTQTSAELSQVVRRVRAGEIKLLYVAPERANEPRFTDFLQTLSVSLVAIDEAHCVSEWGHEFRPAYRELRNLRRFCPDAPVIALTATATRQVRADILSQLGLQEPGTFVSSFNRPNLTYSIVPKERNLSSLLTLLEKYRGESAIIYCGSRKDTEEMALTLRERGFTAEPYHAGLEPDVRRATQERFIRDRTPIVVATIAFGMGINKPDVRLVAHYDIPKSIESYYQETGRAGRDGLPSECVLYFSYAGKSRQEFFINQVEDPRGTGTSPQTAGAGHIAVQPRDLPTLFRAAVPWGGLVRRELRRLRQLPRASGTVRRHRDRAKSAVGGHSHRRAVRWGPRDRRAARQQRREGARPGARQAVGLRDRSQ